ncbi:SWIM zinc finger family protein [Streptomyces sp. NPDC050485]|uniref:SWIM zinc finger family protein n=1 Tax=Streptomyces sp. NPDC050485 TaxID=3365617 RepID=UPI00378FDB0E
MTLTDQSPYRMRFAPFAPLPDDKLCEELGGRLWLDSLSLRAKGTAKGGPFGRARAYARTAPVTQLVIEPGTIRCWINENTNPAPHAYTPQPNPTVHIPVLDAAQWRDLTVITRHLADRFARLPAESVLQEINNTGARNGIRLLPTLDQCHTSCSCSSRSALCKHAATALIQVARCLDAMPLVLLLLRGRSPVDFFSGLQDPDHPSLRPYYLPRHHPDPPAASAQTAYDRWQHSPRPPLPSLPLPPERPAEPVLPAVPGLDAQDLAGLAVETVRRAHALLSALTATHDTAYTVRASIPDGEGCDGDQPVARLRPQIPLQQRLQDLQEATGLTREELARAVSEWGTSS